MNTRSSRLLFAGLTVVLACRLASAATYYVAPTGNDSNDGSVGSPKLTLAGAFAVSTTNDVISVAPGVYAGGVTLSRPVTLISQSGPLVTAINGGGSGNGVAISSTGVRVEGFTISNAVYGVYCSYGANVTPSKAVRCVIRNNSSHGVFINGGKLVLQVYSSLIIRNGGTGYRAQNVDNATPPAVILQTTIAYNTGDGYYDNHSYNCASFIANSVIASNGGIGINRANTGNYSGGITLIQNLVANNAGGDFYSANENHNMVFSGIFFTADPRFSDSNADDFTLSASSPALKNGGFNYVSYNNVNYTSDYDLAGTAFSTSGTNDLGCYASGAAAATKMAVVYVDGTAGSAGDGSLATPFKSLGDGLAFTAPGGTCHVASATYTNTYFIGSGQTVLGQDRHGTRFDSAWQALFFAGNDSTLQNATLGARLTAVLTTGLRSSLVQADVIRGKYGVMMSGQPLLMDRVSVSNITENGVHAVNPNNDGTYNPWLKMVSCLVVSNKVGVHASWDYGGKGAIYFYNTTIARNSSHGFNRSHYSTHTYAYNTIVAFNGGAGYQVNTWGGGTDYMYNSCIFGNTLGNTVRNGGSLVFNAAMVTADPKFEAGGYRLAPGSLCLQSGLNVSANGVTYDQDGAAWSLPYDIGCYDSPYAPPVKVSDSYADSVNGLDTNNGTNPATPKRLIADAIGVTLSNGTCHVAVGVYNESFAVPDTVSVIGTNAALTLIQSIGGYTVSVSSGSVVRALSIYGGTRGINIASHNNRIENCIVDGSSGVGIQSVGRNTVITNCIIRNHGGIGIYTPAGNIIHAVISACIISNNASHGIFTHGNPSPTLWVENCLVANNGGTGIYLNGDNSHVGTNGVFYCTVAGNGQDGVIFDYLYGMRHEVFNTLIVGNGWNGLIRSGNSGTTLMGGVLSSGNGRADLSLGAQINRMNWTVTYPLLQHSPDLLADYTPGAASAALGAACAAPRPAPATDLAGNSRPASGADLGCYQTGLTPPSITRHASTFADLAKPDNSGDGLSWGTAKRDLAEALALTADSGTCNLAAGSYSNSWLLLSNVTLQGNGSSNTVRVASDYEVGIFIPPYASNCTVRGVGVRGGTSGIIVEGANAVLSESRVSAASDYGIVNRGALNLTVDRCAIENVGQDGLYDMLGINRAITLSRCLFAQNARGIALADARVNPVIENCLVISNRSDGIYANIDNIFVGTNLIQHNTLIGNGGNGLWVDVFYNQRGTVQNNLIVSNKLVGLRVSGSNPNAILYHGANLSFGHTNANISITGVTAVPLAADLEVDPLPLRPDYAPAKESPAFNGALPSPLAVDYYGRPRPLKFLPDIGAVENNQTTGTLMLLY